jgi:hypothetical protein
MSPFGFIKALMRLITVSNIIDLYEKGTEGLKTLHPSHYLIHHSMLLALEENIESYGLVKVEELIDLLMKNTKQFFQAGVSLLIHRQLLVLLTCHLIRIPPIYFFPMGSSCPSPPRVWVTGDSSHSLRICLLCRHHLYWSRLRRHKEL